MFHQHALQAQSTHDATQAFIHDHIDNLDEFPRVGGGGGRPRQAYGARDDVQELLSESCPANNPPASNVFLARIESDAVKSSRILFHEVRSEKKLDCHQTSMAGIGLFSG